MYAVICVYSPTEAGIHLLNRTTGLGTAFIKTSKKVHLVGNCAEWVIEDPTGANMVLGRFGDTYFDECVAGTQNGQLLTAGGAKVLEMYDVNGKTIAQPSIETDLLVGFATRTRLHSSHGQRDRPSRAAVVDLPGDVPDGAAVRRALPLPAERIWRDVQPDHPLEDRDPADGRLALERDASVDLDADEVEIRPARVDPGLPPLAVRRVQDRQAPTEQRAVRIRSVERLSSMTRPSRIRRIVLVPCPPPAHDTVHFPIQKSRASGPSGSTLIPRPWPR